LSGGGPRRAQALRGPCAAEKNIEQRGNTAVTSAVNVQIAAENPDEKNILT